MWGGGGGGCFRGPAPKPPIPSLGRLAACVYGGRVDGDVDLVGSEERDRERWVVPCTHGTRVGHMQHTPHPDTIRAHAPRRAWAHGNEHEHCRARAREGGWVVGWGGTQEPGTRRRPVPAHLGRAAREFTVVGQTHRARRQGPVTATPRVSSVAKSSSAFVVATSMVQLHPQCGGGVADETTPQTPSWHAWCESGARRQLLWRRR